MILGPFENITFFGPDPLLTDGQKDRRRDKYTRCTWARGTVFPVVLLCQFFGCGGKQFQVLLTYHTSCGVVSFFWLRWEIVLGCTYQFFGCGGKQCQVLLTTYLPYQLCRCVSFLVAAGNSFGCTVFKKDSCLVSLIERESASKCCVYVVRSNTLLLCISLLCIYLLYRTDPQTHRLDCFLKFPELSVQVGISRIPSKNADRKSTNLSRKHSFTQSVS